MIVYHSSNQEIIKPDIVHSRRNVDFGRAFYTTPLLEQAEKWCKKFKDKNRLAVVSTYTFDESALKECKVQNFKSYSVEWLDFILNCRTEKNTGDYDIVMGGVANDKVFNTVELFFDGLIDKKEAIKRLRYEKPNAQIAFRTQAVIDQYLHFERSKEL